MNRTRTGFDAVDGRVDIVRDALGVPFVSAGGVDGLFEGQGYATACDRLWHIEHDRRRARGTLAAVTGLAAHAQYDAFARRARLVDLARDALDRADPTFHAMCTAYAAGVNRRLDEQPPLSDAFARIGAPRPAPMEAWEPIAIFLVRHATFATWQQKLWNARVAVALGTDAVARFSRESRRGSVPVIVPPGVRDANTDLLARCLDASAPWLDELAALGLGLSGSNAWAVHGRRTTSGLPLVAGDPHRALEAPNVYYQCGLTVRDLPIDAAGFAFPGVPGIGHFGQNLTTAWAVTNAMADYQDLYVERLDDAVVDRRTEHVEVRDGATVEVACLLTRHGPVVSDPTEDGIGLALASTGFDAPAGSLAAVVPQLLARTVDELDDALAAWVEPVNNFVLADTHGDIAYRTAGRVPVRAEVNSWLPVPGWDATHDWTGYVPDESLPRTKNPSAGAVVTANQRITTADHPHLLGVHPYGPNRATRIWARLDAAQPIDDGGMAAVHLDASSPLAARLAAMAPDVFGDWDGRMLAASTEAAVFAVTRHRLAAAIANRLPATLRANPFAAWEPRATTNTPEMWVADALDAWLEDDDRWLLADGETWHDLVLAAAHEAMEEVGGRTWGELHHLQPLRLGERDRLDLGPVDGAHDCVMATNDLAGAGLHALTGSTCRYVWDLADRTRSRWVVPMGSDEDDRSAHHTDQTAAFAAGRTFPVWTATGAEGGTWTPN